MNEQEAADFLKEHGIELEINIVTDKDEPIWKCITHGADVKDLSHLFKNETFDPGEEMCVFESEFGGLDPSKCEIVRGYFIPEHRHSVTP